MFGPFIWNKKIRVSLSLSTAVPCDQSYLVAESNPECESSSGGTTTVYWNAICSVGTSDPCLQKNKSMAMIRTVSCVKQEFHLHLLMH